MTVYNIAIYIFTLFSVAPLTFNHPDVIGSRKNRSPLTEPISLVLARIKLMYFSCDYSTGLCRPIPYFFTCNELRYPMIGGRVFDFPKKTKQKGLLQIFFPAPRIPVPYPLSHVAKRSTPIGPYGPPRRNSTECIYLPLC